MQADGRCRDHTIHELAAEFLRRGELPKARDLIQRFSEQGEMRAYLGSGILVVFLVESFGIAKIKQLWQRGGAEIEDVLGMKVEVIDRRWRTFLARDRRRVRVDGLRETLHVAFP